MSQTKAQLVAPIGVVTASGVVASGVVTASSFDAGSVTGTATSIIQGGNLNVGIMSATSFVGDFTGSATGITTGSDIKVGAFTASSFTGDFTGTATSMMRGTGFEAGAVNATGFVANVTGDVTGNATGLAGSVTSGGNIHVGVMTATSYSGDGSNLTGIAATNFNTQTVTTDGSEPIIDLADGNCITMNQAGDTTVGFASTSEAMDLTLIRVPLVDYNISYSTGGVDFNGSSEYLATGANATLAPGTNDFTIEAWINPDSWATNEGFYQTDSGGLELYATTNYFGVKAQGGSLLCEANSRPEVDTWTHVAVSRSGTSLKIFFNGTEVGSATDSTNFTATGSTYIGAGTGYFDGTVSNLRLVVGTAVYTSGFVPPSAALTNITNTKLLCCQSTSDTAAAAVLSGTTLSASGTAGAHTVAASGSTDPDTTITWPASVKWNNDTAPTLISAATTTTERQQFQFITRDTGLNWYAWETFKNDPPNLELFSWGSNANQGQLGQNNRTDLSSPTQVGSAGNWQAASGHAAGGAGIKDNGTLWAWGENATGELGQNDKTLRSSPVQVGTNKNWKSLQWGNNTCWGLTSSGTLYAWGINPAGQFGSGNVTSQSSPIQIGESGIWSSVQQGGNGVGAAVKKSGGLWRWGANNHGELGMNSRTYYSSPIQLGSGTWKSFGGGTNYNIAVDGDGKLWSMGRGGLGVLAQNDDNSRSSPTQVGTGTDWASVSGGRYWAAALKTDGTLWTWGVNNNGNLGLNSRLPSDNHGMSSPTQLPGTWNVANTTFYSESGVVLGLKEP